MADAAIEGYSSLTLRSDPTAGFTTMTTAGRESGTAKFEF